jgi:hypothetical protein
MYPTSHLQALIASVIASCWFRQAQWLPKHRRLESIYLQPTSSSTTVAADWRITSEFDTQRRSRRVGRGRQDQFHVAGRSPTFSAAGHSCKVAPTC